MHPQLIQQAIQRVAEQKIQDAMQRGDFDDLPGKGKPIANLDEPWDDLWWVKRWLKRERLDKGQGLKELNQAVRDLKGGPS